jgi:hypothetical protein
MGMAFNGGGPNGVVTVPPSIEMIKIRHKRMIKISNIFIFTITPDYYDVQERRIDSKDGNDPINMPFVPPRYPRG